MNAQPCFLDPMGRIPLFPLATAAVMLFYGRRLSNQIVSWLCSGSVFISFIFSVGAFFQIVAKPSAERVATKILFEWIPAGTYHLLDGRIAKFIAAWGFQIDPLSCVMVLLVTGVGLLIHVYSP